MVSGVAAETKDSAFITRFVSYQEVIFEIEETVMSTRRSRDVIRAAGVVYVEAILIILGVFRSGLIERRRLYIGFQVLTRFNIQCYKNARERSEGK